MKSIYHAIRPGSYQNGLSSASIGSRNFDVWRGSLNSSNSIDSLLPEIGCSCPRALDGGASHFRTKNIGELSDDVTMTKGGRDIDQADDQVVFAAGEIRACPRTRYFSRFA